MLSCRPRNDVKPKKTNKLFNNIQFMERIGRPTRHGRPFESYVSYKSLT